MRLVVKGITVTLGSRDVLKDVTFEVEEGELLALLGPNGSGKTTMLRTIFGMLKPLRGVVLLDGKEIGNAEEAARKLGFLPQDTPLTNLRVIDIVMLGRTPYLSGLKRPGDEDYRAAMEALREVGMEDMADRIFSELSGGERQKVMLARVFAQQPEVMLLDEPTAHLDIAAQIEIMEIIQNKVEEGRAALVAIHDINLASSFATRILMVKDGKVAYAGRPEDVINEESIRNVFGADVVVRRYGRGVYIAPKPKVPNGLKRVHVICGGGSGREILHMLRDAGYKVSAGVVNVLDSDWEVAAELGEVVDEAPFSPISDSSHRKNIETIENSDAVVLANLSFGRGNFKNLQAAMYAANLNKLVVMDKTPFKERNFVGKEAEELYREILERAVVVKREEEVLDAVRKLLG
ncbi:MAG: ABC transporter ATP-binding protein [Archaeoglobus sp.]|uniref:ABC transporter ATP-binding protein n=1 Tax=Archaeoglobus sp. TaxID=1872626 RepID=UPI001D5AC6D9|nr:ABC transporter ATP-binding protein [Archaeoglobus sp.]MBO8179708.1 ABC transporter ATP-binding protein [Archaeoglobus sp.]